MRPVSNSISQENDPVFTCMCTLCAVCLNRKSEDLCEARGKVDENVRHGYSYNCEFFKGNMEHSLWKIAEKQIIEKRGFI